MIGSNEESAQHMSARRYVQELIETVEIAVHDDAATVELKVHMIDACQIADCAVGDIDGGTLNRRSVRRGLYDQLRADRGGHVTLDLGSRKRPIVDTHFIDQPGKVLTVDVCSYRQIFERGRNRIDGGRIRHFHAVDV